MDSESGVKSVERVIIVGLGFCPSDDDVDLAIKTWEEYHPDYPIRGCLLTSMTCPAIEGVADLGEAMKVQWGDAFFGRFFADDLIHRKDLKAETLRFDDGRELGIFVSCELAKGAGRNNKVELLVERLEASTPEEPNVRVEKASVSQISIDEAKLRRQYVGLGPLQVLPLDVLSYPLFESSASHHFKPPIRVEERIRRFVAPASRTGSKEKCKALEEATRDLPSRFPDFAVGYLWRCVGLAGLGRFDEVLELIKVGFERCPDVCPLCEAFAYVFEKMGKIEQLGWYMQACYLGTDTYWAYLVLGQAAVCCEMFDFSKRLFAAADILCTSDRVWHPHPDEVERIESLVKSNYTIVKAALERFGKEIDRQLPLSDLIPEEHEARLLWLRDNREEREAAKKKLCRRRGKV